MVSVFWRRVRPVLFVSGISLLLFLITPIADQSRAASFTVAEPGTGITIWVDAAGAYTVTTRYPAWTFSGSTGYALSSINTDSGIDTLGHYWEISFAYQGKVARVSSIRTYESRPIVLFSTTYLAAANNTEPFPIFTTYPQNLFHLSYHGAFGAYGFDLNGSDSPWLFFDAHANSFLLSPAANFMVARTTINSNGSLSSGIDQSIGNLPQHFTQRTILAIGAGINSTYDIWGRAMTDLQGKTRSANDANVTLDKLGYWTDNGSAYYYHYIPTKGYAGTLEAVQRDFARKGIPLGYMQLDSWWYPKGAPPSWKQKNGGIATYTAAPALFPRGLSAFQHQLGLPLITHARWIDASSPYRRQYLMSGNVSIDQRYWQTIMDFLHRSGVVAYEQDWLAAQAQTSMNLTDPNTFLNEMAGAAAANDLTLQYCMPDPRHYLQSTMYSNVLTVRVSTDHFVRARWDDFLYASRFASALGLWPWSDVFRSTETDNLLLSTLSAGMVGLGDPLGAENTTNLMQTIRADGVIVKPDTSIVPADETYIAEAEGRKPAMVAAASTDHDGLLDAYVFAYKRSQNATQMATFTPARLGIPGKAYVYNYFTKRGTVVDTGQSFSDSVGSGSYYVVAPIGPSGIAFLGDAGKFVSLGKKRISSLTDNGIIQATVVFAPGERAVTLHGYAPARPWISVTDGSVNLLSYNPGTHLFSFSASPGRAQTAVVSITLQKS